MKTNSFAFQGVNGAYSEQAGKNVFPNASSVPCATFEEMFACVRDGQADIALVPIETVPSKITFSSIKAPFSIEMFPLNLTCSMSAKETPLLRNFFAVKMC